ncbi:MULTISPECIES: acyl-CoA dehydrogenase family protein [unclassified Mycobacterium]|uniref:acyl-CoA dehydrogenase family protein n=1 Tax=unclassified Mycobacterium TaxID=2642494 RepID=UPI0029C7F5CB|nr:MULTISPECIES: acyl-CoA dehydrogenase family protein [unclassified Mycobacterium]
MDRYELRRLDYGLSEDHRDVQAAYGKFFRAHSPIETVRAAEATGFDEKLWKRLCTMGATTMAVPEEFGGDGASLVDLTLIAEEIGRTLAPVPWIDHVCTTRLLARLDALGPNETWTTGLLTGARLAGFDPQLHPTSGRRLLPSGAVADHIVVRDGERVVALAYDPRPAKVDNIARLPAAWIDPDVAAQSMVLGSGAVAVTTYLRAVYEWHLLTAAALVGLVDEAMTIAAEFAKTRYTLGVPIGTLQGISHPLANIAIAVQSGRNLTHRAAWYLDNEPDERPELACAAFVFIAEEASKAATAAAHVQGGLGVSLEAAATDYVLRARGWPLAGGDPGRVAQHIVDIVTTRERRHAPAGVLAAQTVNAEKG